MTHPPLTDRRQFLAAAAMTFGLPRLQDPGRPAAAPPPFEISLAQWSLHRALKSGAMTNLDFPKKAKGFGITAVEYVNTFWKDKARDAKYVAELRSRCEGEGVRSVLIMCDGEGELGDADKAARQQAVANHQHWVDAAAALGCHAIRVNARSSGTPEEQAKHCAEGLRALAEYGDKHTIDVIVENHGGLSSNAAWLAGVLKAVGHPRCGSLPDFGNFQLGKGKDGVDEWYDRYQGVDELMPFAKGVSAKSHEFDERGEETATDYRRMLKIVVEKHGYHGFVGIEYEGKKLGEDAGILATKKLLETVRAELAAAAAGRK
jgi:sugar phosphate isomerase/epimerase